MLEKEKALTPPTAPVYVFSEEKRITRQIGCPSVLYKSASHGRCSNPVVFVKKMGSVLKSDVNLCS